jgi:hypothetical protein
MERWQDLAHAGVIEYCEQASQGVDGRLDARFYGGEKVRRKARA